MTPSGLAMTASATAFAVAIGANNGATLVALGLRAQRPKPWLLVGLLTITVAIGPLLIGTRVASTFATELVAVEQSSRAVTVVATCGAVFITVLLAGMRGWPTSSFIAVIGALAGAGIGLNRPVHWAELTTVTIVAMTAPTIGLTVAYALTRTRPIIHFPRRRSSSTSSTLAFVLLALTYSAGGAQLVFGMFALTTESSRVSTDAGQLIIVGACFLTGTLMGLRRMATSIGSSVMPMRPNQATRAELASALTMGAIARVGFPASISQVATAALVGCGVGDRPKRVRWQHIAHIAAAWVLTLPTAFILGAALSSLARHASL
jgi:inorganic phosphate transporter, PiT family